jgi:Rieske Fe-S protein
VRRLKRARANVDAGLAGVRRRDVLGAAGGFLALELLNLRCSPAELKPGQIAVPLKDLVPGRRMIVVVAENPVELTRSAAGVTARSLRCTHWGCVVRWREDQRAYICPCHGGRYDADGNVVEGPPPLPLRTVPATVSGDRVILGSSELNVRAPGSRS